MGEGAKPRLSSMYRMEGEGKGRWGDRNGTGILQGVAQGGWGQRSYSSTIGLGFVGWRQGCVAIVWRL